MKTLEDLTNEEIVVQLAYRFEKECSMTDVEVTEEEILGDFNKMICGSDFKLPITGIVGSTNRYGYIEYDIGLMNRYVGLKSIVSVVNFYLQKKKSEEHGEVVVTINESGECILVSRQDEDRKILEVIWEKK